MGDSDNPEVDELLKTAVRWLKERPALFKYCAEEVVLMWQSLMTNSLMVKCCFFPSLIFHNYLYR